VSDQERYFNKIFNGSFSLTGSVTDTETEILAAAATGTIFVTDISISAEGTATFELNDGTNSYLGELNLIVNSPYGRSFQMPLSTGVNKALNVKAVGSAVVVNFTITGFVSP